MVAAAGPAGTKMLHLLEISCTENANFMWMEDCYTKGKSIDCDMLRKKEKLLYHNLEQDLKQEKSFCQQRVVWSLWKEIWLKEMWGYLENQFLLTNQHQMSSQIPLRKSTMGLPWWSSLDSVPPTSVWAVGGGSGVGVVCFDLWSRNCIPPATTKGSHAATKDLARHNKTRRSHELQRRPSITK